MSTLIQLAETIARNAHKGQFRRDGVTPYITHVERVVNRLADESEEVRVVAWLHDVLEDTDHTIKLPCMSEAIVNAVNAITKRKGESYNDYLERVKQDPIATIVKIADMSDNLSDSPTERQGKKYVAGLMKMYELT